LDGRRALAAAQARAPQGGPHRERGRDGAPGQRRPHGALGRMAQHPTSGDGRPRVVTRRTIYRGKVLSLELDDVIEPGGVRARREVVRHAGSVAVLALREDGTIYLVRQYRYPVDSALWELPAGRLDRGESPEEAAQRELREEIGYRARVMRKVAFFHTTPGFC